MIHPHTELRLIDEVVGYGVFATQLIPEGTIVYVKDSLELVIQPDAYRQHNTAMQEVIDKYSYIDQAGDRIISWDFAKYVNHCCNCNSISTGYGFEMALRDIQPGEQITDEYGIFNLDQEMTLVCDSPNCRKRIGPGDFETYYKQWDARIKKSIPQLFAVAQPLLPFIDPTTQRDLDALSVDPHQYKSVYTLKLKNQNQNHLT